MKSPKDTFQDRVGRRPPRPRAPMRGSISARRRTSSRLSEPGRDAAPPE